jgi:hypothetical protein
VFERLPHHLNIFHFNHTYIIRFVLLTLLFFAFSWRIILGNFQSSRDNCGIFTANVVFAARRICMFVSAAVLIAVAGTAINSLMFINGPLAAGLLRFYWFRLADVAVPLGTAIIGCWWMIAAWRTRSALGRLSVFVMCLPVIVHFGLLVHQRLQPEVARAERLRNPSDWQKACFWASDEQNTPKDARFIVPRMSQTFKWNARRPEVATWKDVPQDAEDIVKWWERLNDLFAVEGGNPENRWQETVNSLDADRIKILGEKYLADYLITDLTNPALDLPVVYQNDSYIIYRIRQR